MRVTLGRCKPRKKLNDDDFGNVVLSAIRYGLPRKTGIIVDHIAFTERNWAEITPYWQKLILRDCEKAVADVCRGVEYAVDDLSVRDVREFCTWIRSQWIRDGHPEYAKQN